MTEKPKMTIDNLTCEKIEEKTVQSEKGEVTTYKYMLEGEHNIAITSTEPLTIKRGQEFTARFHDPQSTLDDHEGEDE